MRMVLKFRVMPQLKGKGKAMSSGKSSVGVKQFGELIKVIISVLMQIIDEMTSDVAQGWIDNRESLVRVLREALLPPVVSVVLKASETKTYLRELFTDVKLDATDGAETFQSSGLFTGGIYGLAVPSVAKGNASLATKATVWEMILDGIFARLFGSLGESRRGWTEVQVVRFCRDHRDKLRTGGYGTFFEMKGSVVVGVSVGGSGGLSVYVYSFSDRDVLSACYQHRVVVPQL